MEKVQGPGPRRTSTAPEPDHQQQPQPELSMDTSQLPVAPPNRSAGPHYTPEMFYFMKYVYTSILAVIAVYRVILYFAHTERQIMKSYFLSGPPPNGTELEYITACRDIEQIRSDGRIVLEDTQIITSTVIVLNTLGIFAAYMENVVMSFGWKSLQVTMWTYSMARAAPRGTDGFPIINHFAGALALGVGGFYAYLLVHKIEQEAKRRR